VGLYSLFEPFAFSSLVVVVVVVESVNPLEGNCSRGRDCSGDRSIVWCYVPMIFLHV
jgi:hypothetical protein